MWIRRKKDFLYTPSDLSAKKIVGSGVSPASDNTTGSQTFRIAIPATWPLDSIRLYVFGTITAAGSTPVYAPEGLLNIVRHVTLTRGSKDNPIPVDVSGTGLIEYAEKVLPSLDKGTLLEIACAPAFGGAYNYAAAAQTATGASCGMVTGRTYRICYPILFGHRETVSPLYEASLLDLHNDGEDAELEVTLCSALELSNATAMDISVSMALGIVYRDIPKSEEAKIMAKGGYLQSEIKESETPFASANSTGRVYFPIGRQVTGALIRTFSNSSTTLGTRARGKATDDGQIWKLMNGPDFVLEKFYPFDAETEAEQAGGTWLEYNKFAPASSGATLEMLPSNCNFSYFCNFLSPYGTDANELGSVLNTDLGNNVQTFFEASFNASSSVKLLTHSFLNKALANNWRALKL